MLKDIGTFDLEARALLWVGEDLVVVGAHETVVVSAGGGQTKHEARQGSPTYFGDVLAVGHTVLGEKASGDDPLDELRREIVGRVDVKGVTRTHGGATVAAIKARKDRSGRGGGPSSRVMLLEGGQWRALDSGQRQVSGVGAWSGGFWATGTELEFWSNGGEPIGRHDADDLNINAVAVSGRRLAYVTAGGMVRLLDLKTLELVSGESVGGVLKAVALSEGYVAVGGDAGELVVMDSELRSRATIKLDAPIMALALSADGTRLALGLSADQYKVRVFWLGE